jgi:molybdopterin-containing oxidoreductase family iron-sulfur binding subunit
MEAGHVEVLLILSGNPVFTAPADYQFRERLEMVLLRVHYSLYQDETSRQCHWHLPKVHFLEGWSDTRAFDGTATIVQPLIRPLYRGRSVHELLSTLASKTPTPARELVRTYWGRQNRSQKSIDDFEDWWETALHDGIVPNTRFSPKKVSLEDGWQEHVQPKPSAKPELLADSYELVFESDPTIYDGRFANNGWLQELPKPITRLTWDNAALVSPATARKLGVGLGRYLRGGEHGGYDQPLVELRLGDRKVQAPARIVPGHADGCITISLGYGREAAGQVGGNGTERVGFNAYLLRSADRPWFSEGLLVRGTEYTYRLACTQQHQLVENRAPVRSATLAEDKREPGTRKQGTRSPTR